MHNLVIDIGNTNQKLAVFNGRELVEFLKLEALSLDDLMEFLKKFNIKSSIMSSVANDYPEIVAELRNHTHFHEFSTRDNPGISSDYQTPETLGLDRWAKVIAANRYYSEKSCLMIDAGTCITYDFLSNTRHYAGGSISPGIGMRFEALHHYTERLPLVDWNAQIQDIPAGTDTISAIKNGVLQGVINEIIGNITLNHKENKELVVLITGGDATFLLEQLKNSIFAPQIIHDPYLVLKGLNEVIAFEHVQKN